MGMGRQCPSASSLEDNSPREAAMLREYGNGVVASKGEAADGE